MKAKFLTTIIIYLLSLPALGIFYFSNIPSARSVEESIKLFPERKFQIISHFANKQVGKTFELKTHRSFSQVAVAKAYLGIDGDKVSSVLLQENFKPFGKVGTNFKFIPYVCERKGDYDFALIHLVQLAYLSQTNNFLSDKAYKKLLFDLLTAKGNKHHIKFNIGACGTYKDTENHVLMTETSRYLTNDLLKEYYKKIEEELPEEYDNDKNGFHTWIIKHLKEIEDNFFDEYNSKPYQSYALMPIANLAGFSKNVGVRNAAQGILDHQSKLFYAQSIHGRRLVPFRRQLVYEQEESLIPGDGEIARHALLTGQLGFYPGNREYRLIGYGVHVMFSYAITGIKLNDHLLKKLINRGDTPFYQTFNHQTPELYYQSKNFLLSAGGVHVNRLDGGTKLNDGWAMPTTLMTKENETFQIADLFRFKGNKHRLKRRNTCVYNNFACGINFAFPNNFNKECGIEKEGFQFFDLSTDKCGNHGQVLLILMTSSCDSYRCKKRGKNVGFMEVREKSEISLDALIEKTIQNNKFTKIKSIKHNTYTTSLGDKIEFQPIPLKKREWEIVNINGEYIKRGFDRWQKYHGQLMELFFSVP